MGKPMNWSVILLLCGCVLLKDGPALSEDVADVDCESQSTQFDMNQCAAADYRAADLALNDQWAKTRAAMKRWDEGMDDAKDGAAKRLLDAQRAWLAYRDAACDLEGYSADGGSMQPMVVSSCMAELTLKRTDELKSLADLFGN